MPRTVLSANKETETAEGYAADSPRGKVLQQLPSWTDSSSPSILQMGTNRNRHLLWRGLCLPSVDANAQCTMKGPE